LPKVDSQGLSVAIPGDRVQVVKQTAVILGNKRKGKLSLVHRLHRVAQECPPHTEQQ